MSFLRRFANAKQALNSTDSAGLLIEIDDATRTKLQKMLLDMLRDIEAVCKKYDINLFLVGGSALGAVRHRGFIPWDDDLDTAMTRADYEKFQEIFETELSDQYILMAPNYRDGAWSRFPKVIKKKTVFREIGNRAEQEFCGVFVDIFLIDNVPDKKVLRWLKGIRCNALEFIAGQVSLFQSRSETFKEMYCRSGKANYYFRYCIGFFFSMRKVNWWNSQIDKVVQCEEKNSTYCTIATGRGHYFGEMLLREDFFPHKMLLFEDVKVKVFHRVDKYLANLYGDYMQIPDSQHREKHFVEEIDI